MNEKELFGEVIPPNRLEINKAKKLSQYIESGLPYITLIEIRQKKENGTECIIIDLDIERPQKIEFDIKRTERLAIEFHADDVFAPNVFALRENFPVVPHLILQPFEYPKCLCLYEEPYNIIKLTWTPSSFITQIRNWLSRTSIANLHEEDQSLEPFIVYSPYNLIIPDTLILDTIKIIDIYPIEDEGNFTLLLSKNKNRKINPFIAISFVTPPAVHGVIRQRPNNLQKLSEVLSETSFNFIDELGKFLKDYYIQKPSQESLNQKALFIFSIPLMRNLSGDIERIDYYGFISGKTLNDIGVVYGIFEKNPDLANKNTAILIGQKNESVDLSSIDLYPIRIQRSLSAKSAALCNDTFHFSANIVAIGLGALGSQVANNLIRSGFGEWTFIDEDIFLPHNEARHFLPSDSVGVSKAKSCLSILNRVIDESLVKKAIHTNILEPSKEMKNELMDALEKNDLIFDFSASIAVSRFLANSDTFARSISAFLTPDGKNLIVAAEDEGRNIRLDWLEMLHYREVINHPDLLNSLDTPAYHRYGNSCRDISVQLSQDEFSIWSGFTSKKIRELVIPNTASLNIFYQQDYDIKQAVIEIHNTQILNNANWKITFDDYLVDKMAKIREKALPNETGGILLGNFDNENKKCYIIDVLSAPADSEELPLSFTRGYEDLSNQAQDIKTRTLGQVRYIGEWHSHPDRYSVNPSKADLDTYVWLAEIMNVDCLPAIMMIIGENKNISLINSEPKILC